MASLNDWTLNIEQKNHQSVAYVDFAKASDSVCHNKLLLKLKAYGICGSLLHWISSFLSGHYCQTRIGNYLSHTSEGTELSVKMLLESVLRPQQ